MRGPAIVATRRTGPVSGLGLFAAAFLITGHLNAGDLLRGGAPAQAAKPSANADSGAAAAALARSNAQDTLSRTTKALQSVQRMQKAAQAAAAAKNSLQVNPSNPGELLPAVPDGLAPGGLNYSSGTGVAGAPRQSRTGGGVQVTVKQVSQQAFLNWSSFNIGKNTTLYFDQSAGGAEVGQWIAFNKISDPSGKPSQILGAIKAQGQVYVINPNGIIFSGTSQVNVHTLVASSLPINENLITRGLLNNPDAQFLFSGLPQSAGTKGPTPAFTPTPPPASGKYGDVMVEAGAQLTSPTSAEHVGGRIALIGANVTNAGTISTPDGQTILAAGLQVGFAAHSTNDPSLRGLDVYVGSVGSYSGTATNSGYIDVPRGNVTITGKSVNQLGAINSSTSVSLNGSISLLANYGAVSNTQYDPVAIPDNPPFLLTQTGAVTMGSGSVIYIGPETLSSETIASASLPLRSQVTIQGKSIYFAPNSTLLAPSAVVNVDAGVWSLVSSTPPRSYFVHSGGQIYLDRDAEINVAGSTDVPVSSSQYILTVTLRGSELADSSLQRDSIFRDPNGNSPTITVDLRKSGVYNGIYWVGTPLADLTGYLNLIQRGVGELTTPGGTVNLNAGGSIVIQSEAKIDVSAGWVNYSDGYVKTTRVLYAGHLMDISDATPDRVYQGIYTGTWTETHPHWGIEYTYLHALPLTGEHYEPGYISGANGGSLSLQAGAMALDGTLTGITVAGPRQRETPPTSSALSISFQAQDLTPAPEFPLSAPTPPLVTFGNGSLAPADLFALDSAGDPLPLRADRIAKVILSPSLLSDQGFGQFTVLNPDGTIEVPAKITLETAALGSITMSAANLNIAGQLLAPGGNVSLTVYNISPSVAAAIARSSSPSPPNPNPDRGVFTLASGASISTAGLLIDDRLNAPAPLSLPLVTQGGGVSITAYTADLAKGSVIDVSGGVAVSAQGKVTYGNAGTITIKVGQDPNQSLSMVVGGKLNLGATLKGYSGTTGGALVIQAPAIQIGGAPLSPDSLVLDSSFFSEGGFSSFTLTGLGIATDTQYEVIPGFSIAPGEVIEPVAQSLVAVLNSPGGGGLSTMMVEKPVGLRSPVSLHFAASGVKGFQDLVVRGDLVMGEGSVIRTDPLASVSLSGNTVAVLGSIYAPAGSISLSADKNSIPLFANKDEALTTLYIGPNSVISASGTTVLTPDAFGRRVGAVLPGGSISVTGNIVASAGAVLDVSGTSGVLDLHPATADPLVQYKVPASSGLTTPLYSLLTVPVQVDSNGGSISLTGGQMLFSDATLLGKAGGPTALGGSLSITSGRFYTVDVVEPPVTDSNLVVKQSGPVIPSPLPTNGSAIGNPVNGAISRGYFSADTFAQGGFDSLALNGVVEFSGPVSINAKSTLSVASGGILYADANVHLRAPYVVLGQPFTPPVRPEDQAAAQIPFTNVPPTYGTGRLFVEAEHIDVGTLVLENIGHATLAAEGGDIRGNGILTIAGNLTLRAAQVYPTTLGNFGIFAYDYLQGGTLKAGSITVENSGTASLPLSAGGTLGLYASNIVQRGTLRAPFGVINLGWDGNGTSPADPITGSALPFPKTTSLELGGGSITSVSGVDPTTGIGILVPYGISPDGTTWIDPRGVDITGGGLVQKSINLSAAELTMQSGATLDLRGGGDLFAYRWVSGVGGTINILGSSTGEWNASTAYSAGALVTYKGVTYSARQNNSGITPSSSLVWTQVPQRYAIVPGYDSDYAPYAPFNPSSSTSNLISGFGPGYTNSSIHVGDRIFVGPSATLASGVYTLLPAEYALLPGAVMVTPQSGMAIGTFELPTGSSLVSGYTFNDLNGSRTVPAIASRFQLSSSTVIAAQARYDTFEANLFLKDSARRLNIATPALPEDSGYLLFQATQAMSLQGTVLARPIGEGRGANVDIDSALNFVINGDGSGSGSGTIFLSAPVLSSFGADSLLIGGQRTFGSTTTSVAVHSSNITVDNAGSNLSAGDLILASTGTITLAPGASISSTGTLIDGADSLVVNGNGTLVRVSQDISATILRTGISSSTGPSVVVGAGAQISGTGIVLDSSELMQIDPAAKLSAEAYTFDARRISLQLDAPGALQPNAGLVLSGPLLQNIQAAQSLSLLSYSSIDLYGTGQVGGSLSSIALNAAEIRGFNAGAGAAFIAKNISLGGSASATAPGTAASATGTLKFNADIVRFTAGSLAIDQYSTVLVNASQGVTGEGTGSVTVQNALYVVTPILTGAAGANRTLTAGGTLTLTNAGITGISGGLGSTLTITGQNVSSNANIVLPSGSLSLRSTAGSLTLDGRLDVSGVSRAFYDVLKYTDAGNIVLTADAGNVILQSSSVVDVSAAPAAGNAGALTVSAANGTFTAGGALLGQGGRGGKNGTFNLDTSSLTTTASLSALLKASSFTESQTIRVRTGNVQVNGAAKANNFRLSADQGGIEVTAAGSINASGITGGSISLISNGDLVLDSGALLTVAGQNFNSAGKGGSVDLEAGAERLGVLGVGQVKILSGSTIDLSVASKIAGDALTPGASAYQGQFSGTLHIRAPQNATFTDVNVAPIDGAIIDPSSVLVEAYRIYDLTASGGTITTAIQTSIRTNSNTFLGANGTASVNYTNMMTRLLQNNGGSSGALASVLVLAPGAEIINRTGGLTLGAVNSTTTSDWDLSGFRFGLKGEPGVLTLRAAGNITFYNALSDAFTPTLANTNSSWLWLAIPTTANAALPLNTQSWSYRITAGADFTATDFHQVQPVTSLAANTGSILLGKNGGTMVASGGNNALTSAVIGATTTGGGRGLFQVIRTGSGDIDLNAGASVQLLNQFASIYSAGTRVQDVTLGGTFDVSVLNQSQGTASLGAAQQNFGMTYTEAGGNVTINAGLNVERLGSSSSRELPNNWLYRRGNVNADGDFDISGFGPGVASTAWWIDFTNFFEGVGALGGGNIAIFASGNITNIDAVVPTNARMSKGTTSNPLAAKQTLLELGGGDLNVKAGGNIDAGVYYVERGHGTLTAGGQITTNSTRSPGVMSTVTGANAVLDPSTWLPTTLFIGKGGFDVSARGDVLLGPVANSFLQPPGLGNTFWLKSYFSTYDPDSYVNVESLGGSVTLREYATVNGASTPLLQAWANTQQLKVGSSSAFFQPWLRLSETTVTPFSTIDALMPPTVRATSFSGDINLNGAFTLFPSSTGTIELLAQGAVNGLQPSGTTIISGLGTTTTWTAATINVSDADPATIPGINSPLSYQSLVGTSSGTASVTQANFLSSVDAHFQESGGTQGSLAVLQKKQSLHASGPLHADDLSPVEIYANTGDISGVTLFSPKEAQIFSGRDITDIAFYIQNVSTNDVSIVAATRDVILYDANSLLRVASNSTGNISALGPLAGDIQISGSGTLEVLAGRNLDLGTGPGNADGTGAGITSIGNARNPALPFAGAEIFVGAGMGASSGLDRSSLDFDSFISQYIQGPNGAVWLAEIRTGLTPSSFSQLGPEEQDQIAMKVLLLALRDVGRAHATSGASYDEGYAAIATLFPSTTTGDIFTRSRDIRTKSGGDINIFAPGGSLTLANSTIGNPLVPPGIITEDGGNISILTNGNVDLGIGRIFTLRGGNEIIWSSTGNIAAGASSKTVQSAPPTRVLIDPQSADVKTDLAGLATGGGIGVLATVAGVPAGNVDLIAPVGVVDAGDAGIRATGNLTIAATAILNASNIAVAGSSTGTPTAPVVSAPNIGGLTAASSAAGAGMNAASEAMKQSVQSQAAPSTEEAPSIVTVEVLGYGGTDDEPW